jgi:hypothetical protein
MHERWFDRISHIVHDETHPQNKNRYCRNTELCFILKILI